MVLCGKQCHKNEGEKMLLELKEVNIYRHIATYNTSIVYNVSYFSVYLGAKNYNIDSRS